ncbi:MULTISPECIES: sigma-70 family RNA polymerase sigma factor [unclassified Streptomyces]|uniref:sigma-70 family RNA polymerase sigma factor n=1 Tax=unclassified Streptomyces TaxID=2593676 RepID=UPI00225630C8|nr:MULTISPECIES: sigma-70 family RNA polymerase sigma factor [unclassified Streptomyces]MCX4884196.1 sigma-70 family RNA polymerase sigma factor [Streptomyces sp. NBC_00847]MCX5424314.1 sigma-70 family RNA polymerase sigma factor [Streptomyces sp. NBC_00078]
MITPVLPAPRRAERAAADASATAWALAAGKGDPHAAEHFVRALHGDVLRYVAYLSGDPQIADDLAQDTFLRALDSLPRFQGQASARTWLLSIARRAVADSFRRAAVRPRSSDRHDWQSAMERSQPRGLPGFDDGIALLDLLETLPDERREAFVLTQVVGLSYDEAAGFIGCPVGTVRSRVARARATLERLLLEAESQAARAA